MYEPPERKIRRLRDAAPTWDPTLEEDQRLCERYRLIEEIGRGGMGVVWLAEDERLAVQRASKFLPPEMDRNNRAMKALEQEARTVARLNHPNIVALRSLEIEPNGRAFLVLDYVPGWEKDGRRIATLDDWLYQCDRIPEADVRRLLPPILDALQYAHSFRDEVAPGGIFHRDIKPANILLDASGRPMLADFGIAQSIQSSMTRLTGQEAGSGTLPYMAPEQIMGAPSTARMDIYSLGMTIFELLTGAPPFSEGNIVEQHRARPVPRIEGVSGEMNDLIQKATAKDPEARWISCQEMKQWLEARAGEAGRLVGRGSEPVDESTNPLEEPAPGETNHQVVGAPPAPGDVDIRVERTPETKETPAPPSQPVKPAATDAPKKKRWFRRPAKWAVLLSLATAAVIAFFLFWSEDGFRISNSPPPMKSQDYLETAGGADIPMIWLPGGTFTMGSPSSEARRTSDETQKTVTVDGFWIGRYEVTQDQWEAVMGSNPSYHRNWLRSSVRLPVESVTWDEAMEFCKKLSGLSGKAYTLPTEAQWEYACRAGANTAYCFGDSESQLGDYAWFDGNSGGKTHEVGLKKPNAFGLYDMHGNVWEWCADWYGGTQTSRVCRGGGWRSAADYCRSAYRDSYLPDRRPYGPLGLRLARTQN